MAVAFDFGGGPLRMEPTAMKWEPVAASGTTVLGFGLDVAQANSWLQFAVAALTLAWWIRLWIKNPNIKPPEH